VPRHAHRYDGDAGKLIQRDVAETFAQLLVEGCVAGKPADGVRRRKPEIQDVRAAAIIDTPQ
jgi:hypothetical protein